jgi:hypothetical protein
MATNLVSGGQWVTAIAFLGWRFHRKPDRPEETVGHELTVAQYFEEYVAADKPGYLYVIRHPFKSLRALAALFRLPCLQVALSSAGDDGTYLRTLLTPQSVPLLSPRSVLEHAAGFATAALCLPPEPGQYSLGASKQTLRRRVRRAQRLGIQWAEVNDPQERLALLKSAEEYERTHPDVTYRNLNPDLRDLLGYQSWLAAYSAEGHPLLLCVAPVDGELAALGYFRTIGIGEEQSDARYLMTEVLVEHLVGCRVRYLLDSGGLAIPNGSRHFQRMLGFRIVRVRIARPGRAGSGRIVDDGWA